MRKYDSYKDSGIEWIGEIPSHWEVLNLRKRPFNFEVGKREQTDLKEVVSIGGEHIQEERFFLENLKYVSLEFFETAKNGKIREADILLVKDGATIGKAMFVDRLPFEKMMLNEHVYKIEANKFFYYIIQSPETQYQFWMNNQSSAQESITSNTLKSFVFCWPNEQEQTAIAAYLDRKTAEIDELIADKKRLLELYEEEKTAIINQAVTKGINPNVPMKDSGIEWLGEIPEHWEVKKVKHVLKSLNSIRVPLSAVERGKMVIRQYDYYGASGVIDKVEDYLFEEPLLLIGEDGANLITRSTRLSFIARGKYWVNNHAHILKPTYGLLEYYCELMELCDYSIWISGSAQPKLTSENLMNIQIIVPPFEEQKAIINQNAPL